MLISELGKRRTAPTPARTPSLGARGQASDASADAQGRMATTSIGRTTVVERQKGKVLLSVVRRYKESDIEVWCKSTGEVRTIMTEEQAKLLGKLAVESCSRTLSTLEKETLKRAIDEAENVEQLICVLLMFLAR